MERRGCPLTAIPESAHETYMRLANTKTALYTCHSGQFQLITPVSTIYLQ